MLRDSWLKDTDVRCLEFYFQKGKVAAPGLPKSSLLLGADCCLGKE